MHTTVDYGPMGPDEEQRALRDCREYLDKRYDRVLQILRDTISSGGTNAQLALMLSFAGIQGYPARILIKHIRQEK